MMSFDFWERRMWGEHRSSISNRLRKKNKKKRAIFPLHHPVLLHFHLNLFLIPLFPVPFSPFCSFQSFLFSLPNNHFSVLQSSSTSVPPLSLSPCFALPDIMLWSCCRVNEDDDLISVLCTRSFTGFKEEKERQRCGECERNDRTRARRNLLVKVRVRVKAREVKKFKT